MKTILVVLVFAVIAWLFYGELQFRSERTTIRNDAPGGRIVVENPTRPTSAEPDAGLGPATAVARQAPAQTLSSFQCDGRQHCSQMRSCDEATWFLRHCPGTKMDGDRDGIPCEEQWCGH